jgi:hypothetical protein
LMLTSVVFAKVVEATWTEHIRSTFAHWASQGESI